MDRSNPNENPQNSAEDDQKCFNTVSVEAELVSSPETEEFQPSASEQALQDSSGWKSVLLKFVLIEFAMVPVAWMLISWCGISTPISEQLLGEDSWLSSFTYGLIATVPMITFFVIAELCGPHWHPLQELRELVLTKLMPLLRGIPLWGLLLISLGAGFGEEWLFRGFLQQWLKSLGNGEVTVWIPIIITAFGFALCHAVSVAYFVATFLIGIYFGYLAELTGSVLPAATSHALYDFVALAYLSQLDKRLGMPQQSARVPAELEVVLEAEASTAESTSTDSP